MISVSLRRKLFIFLLLKIWQLFWTVGSLILLCALQNREMIRNICFSMPWEYMCSLYYLYRYEGTVFSLTRVGLLISGGGGLCMHCFNNLMRVQYKKYGNLVFISRLTGKCATQNLKKNSRCSSQWTLDNKHNFILRSQNKNIDFLMILTWLCRIKKKNYTIIFLLVELPRYDAGSWMNVCVISYFFSLHVFMYIAIVLSFLWIHGAVSSTWTSWSPLFVGST